MSIPYFAIGNNELATKKPIGKTVKCPHCGKRHTVNYGEKVNPDGTKTPSKTLGFVNCGKRSYLVSIAGKKL
jgi:hypothetical protein